MSKRVLIVEDEPPELRALVDKFSREGFEALEAKNGEEGLNLALETHPDLILLDIVMPKMDGLTMLKKLREDEWGRGVPVIVLTNLSDGDKARDAIYHGVYDYLVKADWKLEDVIKKVKEWLSMDNV